MIARQARCPLPRALFTALALAAAVGAAPAPALAASMTDAGLAKRVSDLEREVALLKNRLKATKDCDCDRVVRSGNSRVTVRLYGQVNRAVRFAIGRRNAEVHHVDNDTEASFIGIEATARISPDITITATIEAEWGANVRADTDDTTDGNLTVAPGTVDLAMAHRRFGTLQSGLRRSRVGRHGGAGSVRHGHRVRIGRLRR